jgi:broad specificity phosphatase PhoE
MSIAWPSALSLPHRPAVTDWLAADAKGKVTIYVVRHGETDWNLQGRIQETPQFVERKGVNRPGIKSQLAPISIDHIYRAACRAVQTAEAFKGKAPVTAAALERAPSVSMRENRQGSRQGTGPAPPA